MSSAPYPFEHILVTETLLPVRDRAIAGDIEAMFELAGCLLRGHHAAQRSDAAWQVIEAMFDHPDFRQDLQRFCDIYVMVERCLRLYYQEGRTDYCSYVAESREHLRLMVDVMTSAPVTTWNIPQLRHCLDWLEHHQDSTTEATL